MTSLVYTSVASNPFAKERIELLLQQARPRNALFGITGMLLYDYGAFLQVLEGSRVDVEDIFASILRDPRHSNIKVLRRENISKREFGSWSMEYRDISFSIRPPKIPPCALTSLDAETASRYLLFFGHERGRPMTLWP